MHDDAFYVPKEMFEEWAKRDPIERFRSWLRENAELTDTEEEEIGASVKKLLSDAINRADESPLPDPSKLTEGVFATPEDLDTPHHRSRSSWPSMTLVCRRLDEERETVTESHRPR